MPQCCAIRTIKFYYFAVSDYCNYYEYEIIKKIGQQQEGYFYEIPLVYMPL